MEKGKSTHEQSLQPSFEPMRKNEWYPLNTNQPLLDIETNRLTHNLNGAVLAKIRLPAVNSEGEFKQINLIDFGESDQPRVAYWVPGKGELPSLGAVSARYGAVPDNFPSDDPFSLGELFPGDDISIGRNEALVNYRLGFNSGKEEDRSISRKQIIVRISNDEKSISIMDVSSNGTDIWLPDVNVRQESRLKRLKGALGRAAFPR